jgi:Na+-driven multidrug efflux pump
MLVQNISYGLSVFFGWFFVIYWEWGIVGLAMVRNACDLVALVIMLILIKKKYF